jgi:hypothetical protein
MKEHVLRRGLNSEGNPYKVYGGLNYIRGNSKPYFSVTYSDRDLGGCCHELILEKHPDLADLVALHLSDIDGQPMHALENGFYWLGGTHWQRPDYAIAAKHFRISEQMARQLVRDYFGMSFSETASFLSKAAAAKAKTKLAEWVDAQGPRWKAEAETCIAKHGLAVYGDEWKAA